jgi:hypothetical protein
VSDDKMDLEQVGYEGMKWIHLALGRLQWAGSCELVINSLFPEEVENIVTR